MLKTVSKSLLLLMITMVSLCITASAGQVVIIKLDDLRANSVAGFEKVIKIAKEKDIKISFGIIGDSLEDDGTKAKYYDFLKQCDNDGIEIWHHGYTHAKTEYNASSYEDQLKSFQKTMDLMREKCNITLRTFGSPYNNSDATTIKVINNEFKDIKAIMLAADPEKQSASLMLNASAYMEVSTGVVSYDTFIKNYNQAFKSPYIVVQGHPSMWNDESIQNFIKIVDFLKTEQAEFMTPYEYYLKLEGLPAEEKQQMAAEYQNKIYVTVDREYVKFDVQPVMINDRVMTPFRAIFEKQGATVSWDEATKTATAVKDGKTIQITENSNIATVDGAKYELDSAAIMVNGRFVVPARFISESLGSLVYWDENGRTVMIFSGKNNAHLTRKAPEGSLTIKDCTWSSFRNDEIGYFSCDGDIATLWSTEGEGEWICYDLGKTHEIDKVGIIWNKGDQRQAIFDILVSEDGKEFATVFSGKAAGNILDDFENYALPAGTKGRFVKIVCNGNTTTKWEAIKELVIYGE